MKEPQEASQLNAKCDSRWDPVLVGKKKTVNDIIGISHEMEDKL